MGAENCCMQQRPEVNQHDEDKGKLDVVDLDRSKKAGNL